MPWVRQLNGEVVFVEGDAALPLPPGYDPAQEQLLQDEPISRSLLVEDLSQRAREGGGPVPGSGEAVEQPQDDGGDQSRPWKYQGDYEQAAKGYAGPATKAYKKALAADSEDAAKLKSAYEAEQAWAKKRVRDADIAADTKGMTQLERDEYVRKEIEAGEFAVPSFAAEPAPVLSESDIAEANAPAPPIGALARASGAAPAAKPGAAGGGTGSFSAYLAAQGIGVDYVKKFGLKLDDIKSPARFDEALRQQIAAGEVKPADAKKLSDEYKKWYSTGPGLNQRLESSQVQQQRQVDEYQLAAQESKASLADRLVSLEERAAAEADQMEAARVAAQEEYDVSMARMVADHGRLMDDIEHTQLKPFADSAGQARVAAMTTALIFDAVGQALTGKQGRVLEAVDKMVDTEMRKLEFEANKKVEAAQGKMNLMQVVRQTFGDQQQARLVAKQAMYEHIASQVRLEQGKADNSQQRQGLALAADQLERKAEDQQIAFQARSEALAKEAYAAMMMRGSGSAPKGDSKTEALNKIVRGGGLVLSDKIDPKAYSATFRGYVPDIERLKVNEQKYVNLATVLAEMQDIKNLKTRPDGSFDPEAVARIKAIMANSAPKLSMGRGQGALALPEFDRYASAASAEGAWSMTVDKLIGRGTAGVDEFIHVLRRELGNIKQQVNAIPGERPEPYHGEFKALVYERPDRFKEYEYEPGKRIVYAIPEGTFENPQNLAKGVNTELEMEPGAQTAGEASSGRKRGASGLRLPE